jgi:predicted RNase H-like HicB family nuclease
MLCKYLRIFLDASRFAQIYTHYLGQEMLETNTRKVVARLIREGGEMKHGALHAAGKRGVRITRPLSHHSPALPAASATPPDGSSKRDFEMARYTALIDGTAGAYGVTIPNLPGCNAMGETVEEAIRNAIQAAAAWADDARADGEALPEPRSLEALRADPEIVRALASGSVLATVPVVQNLSRPAKANISLDAGLLAAIDEAAAADGLTRSAFIASAAREKIIKNV